MDYMEAAVQLGQAIFNSQEMQDWQDAEYALMADQKGNDLMNQYQEAQMQMVKVSREKLGDEEINEAREALLEAQRQLNDYEVTKNYFQTKDIFQNMMKNINDIIQYHVNGQQESCAGSCSGCTGCD